MRVFGISTGLTVVGNVGNKKQLSRTVLGDAVNLAARVESLVSRVHKPEYSLPSQLSTT